MSEDSAGSNTPPQSAEALTAEIEKTRQELGQTVEALAAKADVKARAQHRATEVAGNLRDKARATAHSTRDVRVYSATAVAAAAGALLLVWLTMRRRRP